MSEGLNFLKNWRDNELSSKAKHTNLTAALLASIDAGYWQPGAKLPTEQELARQTPYSLGTVQRAMRTLVDSGIVVRRRGAGSYVAARERLTDDGTCASMAMMVFHFSAFHRKYCFAIGFPDQDTGMNFSNSILIRRSFKSI